MRRLVVPIAVPAAIGLASLAYFGCTETTPVYGVPMEEDCSNDIDDDGDGRIDCCDDDCATDDYCAAPMCPAYGGPWEEANCSDCRDDMDCDGLIDCDDPDCAGDPACGVLPPYSVPFEDNCSDGVDNDDDHLIDCCDDECAEDDFCTSLACPEYGGPFYEGDCTDCRDGSDCDGRIDCDDEDCAADPACI